jgi:hypothetical protein
MFARRHHVVGIGGVRRYLDHNAKCGRGSAFGFSSRVARGIDRAWLMLPRPDRP